MNELLMTLTLQRHQLGSLTCLKTASTLQATQRHQAPSRVASLVKVNATASFSGWPAAGAQVA